MLCFQISLMLTCLNVISLKRRGAQTLAATMVEVAPHQLGQVSICNDDMWHMGGRRWAHPRPGQPNRSVSAAACSSHHRGCACLAALHAKQQMNEHLERCCARAAACSCVCSRLLA